LAGSAEGFSQADKAINSATKSGRWVMLKNVHLAPQWLVQLEKKLHSLTPHAHFRLFLTMEINPKVSDNYIINSSSSNNTRVYKALAIVQRRSLQRHLTVFRHDSDVDVTSCS